MSDSRPQEDRVERAKIDAALARVYGKHDADTTPPVSVLRAIEQRSGLSIRTHLPDVPTEPGPVLRTEARDASALGSSRYQIVGEIARGGVGVIYQGRDIDLGREVAMKVLHESLLDNREVVQRFVEEAQIGGQLQHPGIVPVYELGLQADDRPFFAMKLVRGETLASQLDRRSDPLEEQRRYLGIFERVCQTMAYAHARNVVHRDLKPSNVMVGSFGEVQIVDWGFAKVLERGGAADDRRSTRPKMEPSAAEGDQAVRTRAGRSHSVTGSVLGTPAYMPPEQARGHVEDLDQRSDVFALGAILCEILTGLPAYTGDTHDELLGLAGVADLRPAHRRLAASGADPELVELARQCLSEARRARPKDAGVLAGAINAHLVRVEERARAAEVAAARAEAEAAQTRKAQRLTVALMGSVVASALLFGGGYLWIRSDRDARQRETTRLVQRALDEATRLQGQAESGGVDVLPLWDGAIAAAQRAAEVAQSGDAEPQVSGRVAEVLTSLEQGRTDAIERATQEERYRELLRMLLEARIPRDRDLRSADWRDREVARLEAAYASAFRQYDVDVDAGSPDDSARALAGEAPATVAAALEHWAAARRQLARLDPAREGSWLRLEEVAQRLDPDDAWRNELRATLHQSEPDIAVLRELASRADHAALPGTSVLLLGDALLRVDDAETAAALYKRAWRERPDDIAVVLQLGLASELSKPPRWRQAARAYTAARALGPDFRHVPVRLGIAHDSLGESEDAIAELARVAESNPDDFAAHQSLGVALLTAGDFRGAIEATERALQLEPNATGAWSNLGAAHVYLGELEQGEKALRRALRDPDSFEAHYNLGSLLFDQGKPLEALSEYRTAQELRPQRADVHLRIGLALDATGDRAGAIAAYREFLDREPTFVDGWITLGIALHKNGDEPDAITAYRRALELAQDDPGKQARIYYELGVSYLEVDLDQAESVFRAAAKLDPGLDTPYWGLAQVLSRRGDGAGAEQQLRQALDLNPLHAEVWNELGRLIVQTQGLDAAIDCFEKSVEANDKYAVAHVNLGLAYQQVGRYRDAVDHLRWAHELGSRDPDWHIPSEQLLREAESLLAQESRLAAILRGEATEIEPAELFVAGQLAYHRKLYSKAIELYQRALESAPALAGEELAAHLHTAGCAAALAAFEPALGDEARPRCRELALAWLNLETDHWEQELAAGGDRAENARRNLDWLQQDTDLAGVRGEELANLPPEEAESWRSLWARIESLLARRRS